MIQNFFAAKRQPKQRAFGDRSKGLGDDRYCHRCQSANKHRHHQDDDRIGACRQPYAAKSLCLNVTFCDSPTIRIGVSTDIVKRYPNGKNAQSPNTGVSGSVIEDDETRSNRNIRMDRS